MSPDPGPNGSGGGGSGSMEPGTQPMAEVPEPHNCQLQLTELAVYQAVKVPLVVQGQTATSFNAPIIEGRRAYFRAAVSPAGGQPGNVVARLTLHSAQGMRVFDAAGLVGEDSRDGVLASTLNFDVPADAIRGDTAVSLEVRLGKECPGEGKVVLPAGGPLALSPRSTGTLKITLVPVSYEADGTGRLPDLSEGQISRYRDAVFAYYPAQSVQLTVRDAVKSDIKISPTGGWAQLLDALKALRVQDRAAGDVYYYGLISPASTFRTYCQSACTAGLSYLAASATSSSLQVGAGIGFSGVIAGETLVHEIGHQHGRQHSPCGDGAGPDRNYPYSDGSTGVWGLDLGTMLLKAPKPPNANTGHLDFMGYCNPQWVSDYTFAALADRRAAVSGPLALVRQPLAAEGLRAQPRRNLLIGAGIDGGSIWGRPVDAAQPVAGQPELAQVLDAAGAVIAQVTVYRSAYGHGGGASLEVPEPAPGWSAISIAGEKPIPFGGRQVPALQALQAPDALDGQPPRTPGR